MPMVTRRLRDPDTNPCLLESDASARCMDENNYDKERCSTYFLRYKNCRKFWVSLPWFGEIVLTQLLDLILKPEINQYPQSFLWNGCSETTFLFICILFSYFLFKYFTVNTITVIPGFSPVFPLAAHHPLPQSIPTPLSSVHESCIYVL
ncbi:coiled-coil-helix-coiled-coil-helix domain containing 7 [Phyllostomus discolor]|uniref:Coiled-coil-helix-coiled-coil-helix domain-containing protein 7 n=1 Tax=Phyllostomus discolor TaxID=89673 RepID=A0A833ZTW2_9CHIR|nr:coiled-coil-helix-coiled-coil-helix domain containing 7 [Phyllostomus discolor]